MVSRSGLVAGIVGGVLLLTGSLVFAMPDNGLAGRGSTARPNTLMPSFNTGHSPVVGTAPLTGVFTNTSPAGATSFTWSFGDGTSLTVPDTRTVSHIYTAPNVYNVTLSATDSGGQVYTLSQTNNVFARPTGGTYFRDVTASSGTTAIHQVNPQNQLDVMGNGVAWCDVNGDGNQDLFVTNNGGANWLFISSGSPNYGFTDQAAARGVDDPQGMSAGAVCVDYDNDGDKDLFVQNFAPSWAPNLPHSRLFQNDGAGHFLDVAPQAGLADWRDGQSSAWADFDKDGLLDVYVVSHTDAGCVCPNLTPDGSQDQLYHQNPDHTFTNVTTYLSPRSSTLGAGFQATWFDFDNDGDLDLYVANDKFTGGLPRHNVLWRNDGVGCAGWCFVDASTSTGSDINIFDMGMAIGDFQNDGYWDVYSSNIGDNVMLRGLAGGQFQDVTASANLARGYFGPWFSATWGIAAIDYDNDKWQDLYLIAGQLGFPPGGDGRWTLDEAYQEPNALFHNRGGSQAGIFDEVSVWSGIDNDLKGRTAAYADYNKDGAVDLYLANFGQPAFLYQNTLHTGNWLQLELQGRGQVPRDAAGTLVKVTTSDGITQMREVQIGTGLGNGHDLALYFGLGSSTSISQLTITWPNGQVTRASNFRQLNRRLQVVQPRSEQAPAEWSELGSKE